MQNLDKPAGATITIDEVGRGTLLIDGHDMSDRITGFTLDSDVGRLTTLRLRMIAVGGIEAKAWIAGQAGDHIRKVIADREAKPAQSSRTTGLEAWLRYNASRSSHAWLRYGISRGSR